MLSACEKADSQSWLELSCQVENEAVDAVAELFAKHSYNGLAVEPTISLSNDGEGFFIDDNKPVTVKAYVREDPQGRYAKQQIERGLWLLGLLAQVGPLQVRSWREEQWMEEWKKHYLVQRIGKRIVIKPSWLEYEPQGDDLVVELDPGMAFGTGMHPTTQMCLIELERHLTPQDRVLDVGTGSGILAICAAKLGASAVAALDKDPLAVKVAKANVTQNRLEGIVQVYHGSLLDEENDSSPYVNLPTVAQQPFDLIVANITARIIAQLASALAGALMPTGTLIAGGIVAQSLDHTNGSLRDAGFRVLREERRNDWVTIIATR